VTVDWKQRLHDIIRRDDEMNVTNAREAPNMNKITTTTDTNELPHDVDTTRWWPTHDNLGRSIAAGDKASCIIGRKNVSGTLVLAEHTYYATLDDGTNVRALVLQTDDGMIFVPTKQLRKLLLSSIVMIP
jgi:hypothetical protein